MKVLNTNIMKVLVPLVTKQYSDGDLDLDEYNNSIYEAHSNDYIWRGPDVGVRENAILGHCSSLARQLIARKST